MLSYGHARWAEPESNRRPPPHQRGALPPELSAVVAQTCDGRGWDRTSSLLCVRQALSRLSYSPVYSRSGARDRTSISTFRAWCPASLDDPGATGVQAPLRPSPAREIDAAGGHRLPATVGSSCHARPSAERCCPCHSPTLRPWITDRRCADPQRSPSYVEGRWSPSSAVLLGKLQAKADAYTGAISREQRCEVFLSQAGPRFGLVVLQAEHHLLFRVGSGRLQKRKRRPSWVALIWPVLRLGD